MFGNSITIGKILGISINVDITWFLIFGLVTWNLAVNFFPSIHPQWEPTLSWSTGILAALLFFTSVVAHELAHAVVAQKKVYPFRV